MSEASRARRQRLLNRLEELNAKYGPPPSEELPGADLEPSWGPVGSLARSVLSPVEYARLTRYDELLVALARNNRGDQPKDPDTPAKGVAMTSIAEPTPVANAVPANQPPPLTSPREVVVPRYCTSEQAQRWADLGLPLDRHGETPVFACLECGADSLKVSVPINAAHCTGCGWSASAELLARRLDQQRPVQPKAVWQRE